MQLYRGALYSIGNCSQPQEPPETGQDKQAMWPLMHTGQLHMPLRTVKSAPQDSARPGASLGQNRLHLPSASTRCRCDTETSASSKG